MTLIAISILNHNSAECTIACIHSLLVAGASASDTCELEIYISDNASREEDQRHLQQSLGEIAHVNFQVNNQNLGFSAGHNRNIEVIFNDLSPDYIWLLNNDCLIAEEALQALVDCANENPRVGIWGATLLEQDGETIQCAGGCFYNKWISSYRQYGRGRFVAQLDQLSPRKFDYIAGASMFFPVTTFRNGLRALPTAVSDGSSKGQQQWLNESFFLYFEELDLAKRLEHDLDMAWCRNAFIKHIGGATTGNLDNQRTGLAEYHSNLSALKFTRQYYKHYLWVVAPIRYISKCMLLAWRGDLRLIGVMTKAYRDFWNS